MLSLIRTIRALRADHDHPCIHQLNLMLQSTWLLRLLTRLAETKPKKAKQVATNQATQEV